MVGRDGSRARGRSGPVCTGVRARNAGHGQSVLPAPTVATPDQLAQLNIPSLMMRAPWQVSRATSPWKSALDELSYTLGIEPIELRAAQTAPRFIRSRVCRGVEQGTA